MTTKAQSLWLEEPLAIMRAGHSAAEQNHTAAYMGELDMVYARGCGGEHLRRK